VIERSERPPSSIAVRTLRTLDLAAASGLVSVGGRLYIVGDDELVLSVFAADDARLLERIPLFPGELPLDPVERKRHKPDLEALALLPTPTPMLLALGSGSRPNRARGAVIHLGAEVAVTPLDLAPLYDALLRELPDLNVEGAAVAGDTLRLLQRGNAASRRSAVIDLDLAGLLAAILAGRPLGPELLRGTQGVELGELGGVALSFTDASPLGGGRLLFTAAAEDTLDTYADGACSGSALGVLGPEREVEWIDPIDAPLKIEGVHATPAQDGRSIEVLMVADADDPRVPSPLLAASVRR
jgi:hypothetical protein